MAFEARCCRIEANGLLGPRLLRLDAREKAQLQRDVSRSPLLAIDSDAAAQMAERLVGLLLRERDLGKLVQIARNPVAIAELARD